MCYLILEIQYLLVSGIPSCCVLIYPFLCILKAIYISYGIFTEYYNYLYICVLSQPLPINLCVWKKIPF
jgi:hypothetical protein